MSSVSIICSETPSLERKTDDLPDPAEQFRWRRREEGTTVESVDYESGTVTLECRGRPEVLERLRGRVEKIE